jgi:hypothetical protein
MLVPVIDFLTTDGDQRMDMETGEWGTEFNISTRGWWKEHTKEQVHLCYILALFVPVQTPSMVSIPLSQLLI